ncbi:MAG: single-stranded-DNA-specific exonuclease RecJ [Candidatus Paceibacterota bacterium]|jgi:single-stranded-DNA-specific exonuclease
MKTYTARPVVSETSRKELQEYSDIVAHILFHRGITSTSAAREFLNPDYATGLHDPFLMKDMEKAVVRILTAIKNNERVVIFSDYDADGIPGAVILSDFFKKINFNNFSNYIPHRHDEGFGLNSNAIEEWVKENVKLVITIDCGIASVKEVTAISKHAIDVIVTDHHEPGTELPEAFAIVDAKQSDDMYPYKMLCGAGVVYKLVQAILSRDRFSLKEGQEKWFLDMAGLATLADMVPLNGENRVLATFGLKVLRKSPRPGIVALCSKLGIQQAQITEDDIGFSIVPRINAASRMGESYDAFRLLSSNDPVEARALAKHLDTINDERKGTVAAMVREVKKIIAERETVESMKKVIVIGNPKWRPSLLGLVANSLVDEHSRPVFLWGRDGEENIKGSCRAGEGASVIAIMEKAKHALLEYGGHNASGGFSVAHDVVHKLEEELVRAYESLPQREKVQEDFIDAHLDLKDVTMKLYSSFEALSPFGVGNPKPIFMFRGVIPSEVKLFGKEKNHLELSFDIGKNKPLHAIGFFMKPEDFDTPPVAGTAVNLVATLEKSLFRGFAELRLRIIDIV